MTNVSNMTIKTGAKVIYQSEKLQKCLQRIELRGTQCLSLLGLRPRGAEANINHVIVNRKKRILNKSKIYDQKYVF